MKTMIRLSVAALVLTGAIASTQVNLSAQTRVSAKASSMPVPYCPPDGSTSCGITGNDSN
jgi:hypothetical protein